MTSPAQTFMLKCDQYVTDDRWAQSRDAFKYTVAHSEETRTIAFAEYGVTLQFGAVQSYDPEHRNRQDVLDVVLWTAWGAGNTDGILKSASANNVSAAELRASGD